MFPMAMAADSRDPEVPISSGAEDDPMAKKGLTDDASSDFKDNLSAVTYQATASYHNTLVSIRFTRWHSYLRPLHLSLWGLLLIQMSRLLTRY